MKRFLILVLAIFSLSGCMSSQIKEYKSWKNNNQSYAASNVDNEIAFLEESYNKVSQLKTLGVVFNKGLELERISTKLDAAYAFKEGKITAREKQSIVRRADVVYEQKKSQADSQAMADQTNFQAQQYLWNRNFNSYR